MNARIRQSSSERRTAMRFRSLLAAFFVAPLLGACTGTTEPAPTVRIVPASPTVVLQTAPTGRVLSTSVTLTNTSKYPVVYSFCGLTLERKVEGFALPATTGLEWIQVWAPTCMTILLVP